MNIAMEIFEDLWNKHLYYKGVKVNMFGIPIFWENEKRYSKNSFDVALLRLAKKKYMEKRSGKWFLTELGKKYFENKRKLATKFYSPFVLNSPKNLLLMFDIPESKKTERNWLRCHLKEFQYFMIQKSVWVGPSPLPKKFISHLKSMGLNTCIKTFKLAKPYRIDKK